ncbi:MAG: hypothetical protein ACD_80C00145G0071 [uncultured bacterium (gcode 4)]|uniref:Peptide deformylase n=1 Tax=uncultured bacterium (gcode 4) TaxID=1234023 RepID=K1XIE4_9BACT|nr:MAG: hypothetical protein ACD_80C00145G0071 [uncultured bacterium (gcode 4)]
MIIEKIVQIWNPILSQKSEKVKDFNALETKNIIENLVDTMRASNLVGMAAVQIWAKKRIFVTEIRKTPTRSSLDVDKLKVYINPKIIWKSKVECIMYEWCGSIAYANLFGPVKRPKKIIIEVYDQDWIRFTFKADGLLSRVIQHEYDHLEGIEFTEKLTDIKKIMSREEYIEKIVQKKK